MVKGADEEEAGNDLRGEGAGGANVSLFHHVTTNSAALASHVLWKLKE